MHVRALACLLATSGGRSLCCPLPPPRHTHTLTRLTQGDFYVMIMDLLGSSLWDVWNQEGQQLSAQYVACVAVEALAILEALHIKG